MPQGVRCTIMALASVLALGFSAIAADQPAEGDKVIAKSEPASTKRRFVFRGSAAAGAVGNPSVGVTSLSVSEVTCAPGPEGECSSHASTGAIALDPSLWKALGNPAGSKGFRYRDPSASRGGVRTVLIRSNGKLRIKSKGDDWPLMPTGNGSHLQVRLATPFDTYCADFGGTEKRNQPGFLAFRDAPAPPSCNGACGNGVIENGEDCDPPDGAVCDASCQLLCAEDAGSTLVECSSSGDETVALAGNGDNFLIGYSDIAAEGTRIRARRLDSAAQLVDAAALDVSGGAISGSNPLAVVDGNGFQVAWLAADAGFGRVRSVPFTGSTLGAVDIRLVRPPHTGGSCGAAIGGPLGLGSDLAGVEPHLSYADTLFCPDPFLTYLVGVPGAGVSLEDPYLLDSAPAAFAASTSAVAAVWERAQDVNSPTFNLMVNWMEPAPLAEELELTSLSQNVYGPAVASVGDTFLAVWATSSQVRGCRFLYPETLLDPDGGFLIATATEARLPAVAADGGSFVVAWRDRIGAGDEVRSVHVTAGGSVVEPSPVLLSSAGEVADLEVAGGASAAILGFSTIEAGGKHAVRALAVP